MDYLDILRLLDSTLRLATPLLLACLAGLFSERAGIFDIGLEGKMLAAAFASAAVAVWASAPVDNPQLGQLSGLGWGWQAAWLGVFAGIVASVFLSIIHGLASITLRGNQLISGVAINFLAAGLTVLISQNIFKRGGQTPPLTGDARFSEITLPFAETLSSVPIIGLMYSEVISGHVIFVYVGLLCVPLTWWVLFRTRFGLRLRAVGENPGAVDTAGISVTRLRYAAVIICGVLCGLAGAYLSMGTAAAGFGRDMTALRGFIALAALIFARWRPWAAMWACLLFGFLQAVSTYYPKVDVFGLFVIPSDFMEALPYILTVVILAGVGGKAIPPRAGGVPYVKER